MIKFRCCTRFLAANKWQNGLKHRNYHILSSGYGSSTSTLYKCDSNTESKKNKFVINATSLRYLSSTNVVFQLPNASSLIAAAGSVAQPQLANIPDIPVAPTPPITAAVDEAILSGAEPTFASLGLGGWTPIGLLQSSLEWLHITCDLPWWAAIAVCTIIVRALLTPLVIIAQRNAAVMNNVMPEMQKLQAKMTEARQMGNAMEAARSSQEISMLMREKNFNPFKSLVVPCAQIPIFVSFFTGLRQMVNTPVESMQTGGALWFTDLTAVDPYYILPVITCATLSLTIELGSDTLKASNQAQLVGYVLRAIPVVIFPFIMNFPAGMVTYWATANVISLVQSSIFKLPAVREYCKIPLIKKHAPSTLVKKKKFVEGVKNSWSNLKLSKTLDDRKRMDEINFERAAQGALIKTYRHDPTKARTPELQAKKA